LKTGGTKPGGEAREWVKGKMFSKSLLSNVTADRNDQTKIKDAAKPGNQADKRLEETFSETKKKRPGATRKEKLGESELQEKAGKGLKGRTVELV